jgi:hypothetical protein
MAEYNRDEFNSIFGNKEEEEKKKLQSSTLEPVVEAGGYNKDEFNAIFGNATNTSVDGYTPFGQVQQDVDHRTLNSNDDWVRGSQNFFEMTYGYVPQRGDDKLEGYDGTTYREKITDYGLKQMAGFNYNIGDMAIDTTRVLNSDQKMKESFVYMLDQYDNVDTSWHTAGQAGWEMMTDITNWAGLLTLGTATVAGTAAKFAGKQGVKELLLASLAKGSKEAAKQAAKLGISTSAKRAGALAGTEGMIHGVAMDSMTQHVRMDAGAQEEYNYGQTALVGGLGLIAGATLGTALDLGISKVASKKYGKEAAERIAKEDAVKIEAQIIAERKLQVAKTEAGVITKAVDDEVPLEELNQAVTGAVDVAKAADADVPDVLPTLPSNLKGARPTYNYGATKVALEFENDIARALYIVGNTKRPSKNHHLYMDFLTKAGVKDIETLAAAIRPAINAAAKKGEVNFKVGFGGKLKTKAKPKSKAKPKDTSDPRPPKAKLAPSLFKHAHNIFDTVKSDKDAVQKILTDFEENQYTPKEFEDMLKQINAADELMGFELDRVVGKLAKEGATLIDSERKILEDMLVKANDDLDRMGVIRQHANAYSGRNLEAIKQFMTYRKEIGEPMSEAEIRDAKGKYYNNQLQKIHFEHNVGIDAALKKGDREEASRLRGLREEDEKFKDLNKEMVELDIERTFMVKKESELQEQLLEWTISGVFSTSTIIFNSVWPLIKTHFYPLLDATFSDPLKKLTWQKNLRVYSQMAGAMKAAMISARAASRHEGTFLTTDTTRFLEGGVKVEKVLGSARGAQFMRFFPRLVGSSDAFNQEIAAVSVLTANAFDQLATIGQKQGLKGEGLIDFIDNNIQREINKGYDFHITEKKLKPIYETGARRGYTGKKLEDYVESEIDSLGKGAFKTLGDGAGSKELRETAKKLFSEGTVESKAAAKALRDEADSMDQMGEEALDAVRTLLYKKDFKKGGKGFTGKVEHGAAVYEDFAKENAWAKLAGNLFFRTPVWLFTESLRLTPAINSLLPQFKADLGGANGVHRQARAKTEAAVAYAWMTYVMTKFAQGEIAGSADTDYTMKGAANKSSMRPLTIKDPFFFSGGKEVSFARWEPLRIPATIVTNTLQGYLDHQEKLNMDGVTDDGLLPDEVTSALGIAFATAISAIRDSALSQGITDAVSTGVRVTGYLEGEGGEDSEKAWDILSDWALKKSLAMVPSSIKKIQEAAGNTELTQPKTKWQNIVSKVDPDWVGLPRRYDSFGHVMTREAAYTQITGFGSATSEDLSAGRSKEHMEANDYLARLEGQGFGNFTRQKFRDNRFPNKDLRTIQVQHEGREMSLFDAMMLEMANDNGVLVANIVFYARATNLPLGSPLNTHTHGIRVTETKKLINEARTRALDNVILQNKELWNQVQDKDFFESQLKFGFTTDHGNNPLID